MQLDKTVDVRQMGPVLTLYLSLIQLCKLIVIKVQAQLRFLTQIECGHRTLNFEITHLPNLPNMVKKLKSNYKVRFNHSKFVEI